MSCVSKRLVQARPADIDTRMAIYSAPLGKRVCINSVVICNTSPIQTVKARVFCTLGGTAEPAEENAIYYDVAIKPSDTFLANPGTILEPGGRIAVEVGIAATLTFTFSGVELDG